MTRFALLPFGLAMIAVGCSCRREEANSVTSTTRVDVSTSSPLVLFDQLKPAGAPPPKAMLTLEGTKVPVTVKTERKEHDFAINLFFGDELFDSEHYVVSRETFALAEAAGEKYEPPIPLIEFPFHLGQEPKQWEGTFSSMHNPHPAHATITMDTGDVPNGNTTVQAYQVEVSFTLEKGASRKLSFWFVPGKGLIKREFGASQREPVTE